jgi:hypothetical protein
MAVTLSGPPAEIRELFALASDPSVTASLNDIVLSLSTIGLNQGSFMATLQEVKDSIAAEKAEVRAKLDALGAQIADLQAQLAAGTVVSAADLDALKAAVEDIFTA